MGNCNHKLHKEEKRKRHSSSEDSTDSIKSEPIDIPIDEDEEFEEIKILTFTDKERTKYILNINNH